MCPVTRATFIGDATHAPTNVARLRKNRTAGVTFDAAAAC
jgi:hypothetical protein